MSSDEMMDGVEPGCCDKNDRDDVVQQTRHDQDQNAAMRATSGEGGRP
jgi:hypothetical protein